MAGEFEGKVVLVTGGGRGIGLATARAFAREGARVFVADVNGDSAAEVAAAIAADGGEAASLRVDVSDPAQCAAMVDRAVARFGGLHIAVNNAGIRAVPVPEFEELEIDDWRKVIDVNLSGVFYCMKAEVPAMRKSGGTAIVNTCSAASFLAARAIPAYIASKHGLAGLTKAAAMDLIRHGIRVNAIAPGATEQGMLGRDAQMANAAEAMIAMQPIGRLAQLDEMADGIVYLASDRASFVVGTVIRIDGGMTLG